MLNRDVFLRPIAHRGLHNTAGGRFIENTEPAFEAAISKGYGIELDVRPGRDGWPLVFHDATTGRLMDQDRNVATLGVDDIAHLTFLDNKTRILPFEDCLGLIDGRTPLMVEIKSEWDPPNSPFIQQLCTLTKNYRGPIALKSFDPVVMMAVKDLAPQIPRGIISCDFSRNDDWRQKLGAERCYSLANLLESGPVAPSFYSYDVKGLPTAVTRFAREVQGVPIFTWTVRTPADWKTARQWADAPIFEDAVPEVAS